MKKKYLPLLLFFGLILWAGDAHSNKTEIKTGFSSQYQNYDDLYQNYDADFLTMLESAKTTTGKEIIRYLTLSPDTLTKHIIVSGSYYDLGYQIGLIGQQAGHDPKWITEENRVINAAVIAMYQTVHPVYLEKARGVAAVYGRSLSDIDMTYLEHHYFRKLFETLFKYLEFPSFSETAGLSEECSAASYYLPDIQTNLAFKNMDGGWEFPRFFVESYLDDVYQVIGDCAFPINQTMNDGINEKGLFIGFAGNGYPQVFREFGPQIYPEYPAVCHCHAARIALEKCANVEEALDFFRNIRIWIPDGLRHFLIADAAGNSVVLEWDLNTGDIIPYYKQGQYQVMTNTSFQIGLTRVRDFCWRYRTADDLFALGITNMDEFFNVIKEIQYPPETGARTVWTALADLSKLEITVYPWEFHNQRGFRFKILK